MSVPTCHRLSAGGRTCQKMYIVDCVVQYGHMWAYKVPSAYIVERILNAFINEYVFCIFVVGISFSLAHFITSLHAEEWGHILQVNLLITRLKKSHR